MEKTTGENSAVRQSHSGACREDAKSSVSVLPMRTGTLLQILRSRSLPHRHLQCSTQHSNASRAVLQSGSEHPQPKPKHIQRAFYLHHNRLSQLHF